MAEMPGIIHIRVDDRLLHGQVCAVWTGTLESTRIMVANDAVAENDLRKSALRMAAPPTVRTSLIGVERAARQILEGKYAGQRVFLIVDGPADLLRLLDYGLPIKTVNVGNMAPADATARQIKKSVSLTSEQEADFRKVIERGVDVTSQMVPSDPMSHLIDFLDA